MPITLANSQERVVFREWKSTLNKHKSYLVKNKYFKDRKIDEWEREIKNIDTYYRNLLKTMSMDRIQKEQENIKLLREEEIQDEALLEQKRQNMREKRSKLKEERKTAPVRRSARIRIKTSDDPRAERYRGTFYTNNV
tara:strand:- start:1804 stop:2217 length:414 start_codon:yes stop_codon:yes gene_type:complete